VRGGGRESAVSEVLDDALDLVFASGVQQLDEAMQERGVSPKTREQIRILARSMFEFVPYALAQGKRPDDVAVFLKFAKARGLQHALLFGDDTVGCGVAVVGFLKSAGRAHAALAGSGPLAVPAGVLAFGLLTLDLLEVGNSCPIVQQAYYEGFLRTSRGDTLAARRMVEGRYGAMCRPPPAPACRPALTRP